MGIGGTVKALAIGLVVLVVAVLLSFFLLLVFVFVVEWVTPLEPG